MYVMLTPELARRYSLPADHGAMVIRDHRPDSRAVLTDSPAAKAGLREHDIIIKLNGTDIAAGTDLTDLLQKHKVGDTLTLTFLRGNAEHECAVTLVERA
jgi:S1-C subfamily serine protease